MLPWQPRSQSFAFPFCSQMFLNYLGQGMKQICCNNPCATIWGKRFLNDCIKCYSETPNPKWLFEGDCLLGSLVQQPDLVVPSQSRSRCRSTWTASGDGSPCFSSHCQVMIWEVSRLNPKIPHWHFWI